MYTFFSTILLAISFSMYYLLSLISWVSYSDFEDTKGEHAPIKDPCLDDQAE